MATLEPLQNLEFLLTDCDDYSYFLIPRLIQERGLLVKEGNLTLNFKLITTYFEELFNQKIGNLLIATNLNKNDSLVYSFNFSVAAVLNNINVSGFSSILIANKFNLDEITLKKIIRKATKFIPTNATIIVDEFQPFFIDTINFLNKQIEVKEKNLTFIKKLINKDDKVIVVGLDKTLFEELKLINPLIKAIVLNKFAMIQDINLANFDTYNDLKNYVEENSNINFFNFKDVFQTEATILIGNYPGIFLNTLDAADSKFEKVIFLTPSFIDYRVIMDRKIKIFPFYKVISYNLFEDNNVNYISFEEYKDDLLKTVRTLRKHIDKRGVFP